jgi:hypothetical protein
MITGTADIQDNIAYKMAKALGIKNFPAVSFLKYSSYWERLGLLMQQTQRGNLLNMH